jgi:hypothetical protein
MMMMIFPNGRGGDDGGKFSFFLLLLLHSLSCTFCFKVQRGGNWLSTLSETSERLFCVVLLEGDVAE